jgi:hypothetical protein
MCLQWDRSVRWGGLPGQAHPINRVCRYCFFFPILACTTCPNPMRGSRIAQLRITTLGVLSQPKATTTPYRCCLLSHLRKARKSPLGQEQRGVEEGEVVWRRNLLGKFHRASPIGWASLASMPVSPLLLIRPLQAKCELVCRCSSLARVAFWTGMNNVTTLPSKAQKSDGNDSTKGCRSLIIVGSHVCCHGRRLGDGSVKRHLAAHEGSP